MKSNINIYVFVLIFHPPTFSLLQPNKPLVILDGSQLRNHIAVFLFILGHSLVSSMKSTWVTLDVPCPDNI